MDLCSPQPPRYPRMTEYVAAPQARSGLLSLSCAADEKLQVGACLGRSPAVFISGSKNVTTRTRRAFVLSLYTSPSCATPSVRPGAAWRETLPSSFPLKKPKRSTTDGVLHRSQQVRLPAPTASGTGAAHQ